MDNQTCHHTSDTQEGEGNRVMCEKMLRRLFRIKEKMNRPLNNFTVEDVSGLAEQINRLIKTMSSLPTETCSEYIRSSEVVSQCMQNTVVKLSLALDQLSSSGDKALFYKHLLSSQLDFDEIFTHGLSEAAHVANTKGSLTLITNLPHRPSSNYKAMLDFSHDMLPDLYNLFQDPAPIWPEQCEQAISSMRNLEALFERQKAVLDTPSTASYESDECATLHCKLSVALAYASELTQKLISLFSAFQTHCTSQSGQTIRSREEIMYYLTLFSYHYNNVLQKTREMNALQDQSRFLPVQR